MSYRTSTDSKAINKSPTVISLRDLDLYEELSNLDAAGITGSVCAESEQLFANLRAAFEAGDVLAIAEANRDLFACFFGEEGSFKVSSIDAAI